MALRIEDLEEALADATRVLAADEQGWSRLGESGNDRELRDYIRQVRPRARIASQLDPLLSRGLNLRVAYVWGDGATVSCPQEEGDEQDVNAVIQEFLDHNVDVFSGPQACEERERALGTDGELFHALFTDPRLGTVQIRRVPVEQVVDLITDPEDAATPWFYKRQWTERVVTASGASTQTQERQREALYPDVDYRPKVRAKMIDNLEVFWTSPIVHTSVNRIGVSRWGIPDVLAAMSWAVGYKDFLGDWATIARALSRFAFKATTKTQLGAQQIRSKFPTSPADPTSAGKTVVMGEGQQFNAIGKSGATLNSESGRPLAAMVAAALDIPVTMLLSDPGITGSRATAETLDEPMRLIFSLRRQVHRSTYKAVLGHVIREAVRAPGGPLKGTVLRDIVGDREITTLAGDQPWGIQVDFPTLEKAAVKETIDSLAAAKYAGMIGPLAAARTALATFRIDDMDAALDELIDDEGKYSDPTMTVGDIAGMAASAALRAGEAPSAFL